MRFDVNAYERAFPRGNEKTKTVRNTEDIMTQEVEVSDEETEVEEREESEDGLGTGSESNAE